jgi:hypothetical protein
MRKFLVVFSIVALMLLTTFIYIFKSQIGFPVQVIIYGDCFGIKKERTDSTGTKRISCYGFVYNYWLE